MNTNNQIQPTSLSECFDLLNEILNDSEDKDWFKSSSEEEVLN